MQERRRSRLWQCGVLIGLCVLASGLTPYGVQGMLYPLREAAIERALGWNGEWEPPTRLALWIYLGYLGVLGMVTAWTWRARRHDRTTVLVAVVFLLLGCRYARAIAEGGVLSSLAFTQALTSLWQQPGRREGPLVGLGLVLSCAVVALFLWRTPARPGVWPAALTHVTALREVGTWNLAPQQACLVRWMDTHGLQGHVWSPSDAAYLVWRMWPRVTVALDTRLWAYGAEHIRWEYDARQHPDTAQHFVAQLGVDYLIGRHTQVRIEVFTHLVSLGWTPIYLDDRFTILAAPAHTALITRAGYRQILPWTNLPVTPENARVVLAEARQALTACPGGASFAWSYEARALRLLGRFDEARAAAAKVPKELVLE